MAIQTLTSPSRQDAFSSTAVDPIAIDLTRLLSRLEHIILSPSGTTRLHTSSYERSKVGANLEHARTLLLRLEHAPKPKPSKRSSQLPASTPSTSTPTRPLVEYKTRIKALQDRLYEFSQLDESSTPSQPTGAPLSDVSDDDYPSDEDLLATYAPAVPTSAGISTDKGATPLSLQQAQTAAAAASVASALRPRRGAGATVQQDQDTARGSGHTSRTNAAPGHALPTTTPFAPHPSRADDVQSHAQLLEGHDAEQDQLTASLLQLASALKSSTQSFSAALTESNPMVDRAAQALDRNVGGMERATARMGLLRRATEGKGWWDRLGLYAKIGVLWVVIILVVFVGPKIRPW